MGFASAWLREMTLFQELVPETPLKDTGIILAVPAYNEPQITRMLDSLKECAIPGCETEVIVVINAPENAPPEHIEGNRQTLENIKSWKEQNKGCFFRLFCIEPTACIPGWGVGLARKTAMDEALRRFDAINRPEGVILCLDADCTVESGYLRQVCDELLKKKERDACSIYFEHPLTGNEYPELHYKSILLYELHLRYYYQGLIYSGFPYAFQTTGSAMAVKAFAYMKVGGMNRRQAGEDFYFIQKLVSSAHYFYLNSTTVYPSPRTSYRVPFGTGASMQKLIMNPDQPFMTYNPRAFNELKTAFSMLEEFFEAGNSEPGKLYLNLPESLKIFIGEVEWTGKVSEIKNNTKGFPSFQKRFFAWFNMFKIVKYLNFVHQDYFRKVPVELAASSLPLGYGNIAGLKNAAELLDYYRSLEKSFKNSSC